MIGTLGEIPDHFLVVAEHEARLAEQAGRLGEVALVRAIDELSAAIAAIREGDEARMTVELALLRSARPEIDPSRAALAQRLERLEQALAALRPRRRRAGAARRRAVEPARPRPSLRRPRARPRPDARGAARAAPAAVAAIARAPSPPPRRPPGPRRSRRRRARQVRAPPPAAAEALDLDRVAGLWPAVLDQMRQSGAGLLSAAVGDARPVAVDPERRDADDRLPARRRLQPPQGRGQGEPRARRRGDPRGGRHAAAPGLRRCSTPSPPAEAAPEPGAAAARRRERARRALHQRVRRRGADRRRARQRPTDQRMPDRPDERIEETS